MVPVLSIINMVLLFGWCIALYHATELKYEIFTATDKTKWIRVSQLEQIFSSIEETLREMNEKQKQDTAVMQLSTTIQSINIRLQGMEEQLARIERAESYNKVQLQQFADGEIKEEIQIDQISHRMEKNQQHLNQRLNDMEFNLEAISKIQDGMGKEIRKINVAQNALNFNVDELSQHTKQQSSKILQNITHSQQEFHKKMKDSFHTPNQEEKIQVITTEDLGKGNSTNQLKASQNDDTQMKFMTSVLNVEFKYDELKTQLQSVQMNLLECTEVSNKIYNKLDHKKDDLDLFLKDQFKTLSEQIKQQNSHDLAKLEEKFQKNFDSIHNEQMNFTKTCNRMKIYEEQMEDKAVEILEKLFYYIDNRTYEIQHEIASLAARDKNPIIANQTYSIRDVKLLSKLEEEPLRTVPNYTLNDAPKPISSVTSAKPNITNGLAGTNVQDVKIQSARKTKSLPELIQNVETEKLWLADERQEAVLAREKVDHYVQQQNATSASIPPPLSFYGIEGLSGD